MDVKDCNSQWAQGGIIYKGKADSPELLGRDIHIAGAGRCKSKAVSILSEEGPSAVEKLLLTNGAQFDRNDDGSLALCLEGGHGQHRIVHWGDQTGAEIIRTLHNAVEQHPKITVRTGLLAHELSIDGNRSGNRWHRRDLRKVIEPKKRTGRWHRHGDSSWSRRGGYGVRPVSSDYARRW